MISARCLLLLQGVAVCSVNAQQRIDITPFLGYRSAATFSAPADAGEPGVKARLSDGRSMGIAAGFRWEDTAVVEFRFTRQNTATTLSGTTVEPALRTFSTRLEEYHADFMREFPLENAPRVRPFLNASVGVTRLSWTSRSESRFSFGIGGGVKYFPLKWFGIRLQAQWLPIWLNPEVKGLACGGGCVVSFGGKLADQAEVSLGPIFSF